MLMWVTNEYYKNVTEILKEYYKWAKRIENNILKGYNWFVLMVKQNAEANKVKKGRKWENMKKTKTLESTDILERERERERATF